MKKLQTFLILIVGISLVVFVKNRDKESTLSEKTAWNQASSLKDHAEVLINNKNCNSSHKNFLGCVNALNKISISIQNKKMNSDLTFSRPGEIYEKKYLSSWSFRKIKFESIFKELINKVSLSERNYFYGKAINSFLAISEDPHTYIRPLSLNKQILESDNIHSIWFDVGKNIKGNLVFRSVRKGSVFEINGIKKGDEILSINSIDSTKMSINEAKQILDKKEITHFEILRNKEKISLKFKIEIVPFPDLNIEEKEGYSIVSLYKFGRNTCENLHSKMVGSRILEKPIVLDLRSNGGGYIDTASCIGGLFLPRGSLIYSIKAFDSSQETNYFTNTKPIFQKDLFVLVNSQSASASELLSGALKYYKRALIIGQSTYGKGSYQEGEFLKQNKDFVKYQSKGLYYLPSGTSPQLDGISPDVLTTSEILNETLESDNFSAIVPDKRGKERKFLTVKKMDTWDDEILYVEIFLKKSLANK